MARTWLLVTIASTVCVTHWLVLADAYGNAPLTSPIAGVLGARYAIVQFAQPLVLFYTIGVICLAFDVRARNVREHITDTLDSRPVTNFELLGGGVLGTMLPLLFPAVLVIAAILFYSWVAPALSWEMNAVVEVVSVLSFLTWDIVPNILLWGSLTVLLSIILRSRMVVGFAVLGIFFIYLAWDAALPMYFKTGLSTFTGVAFFASDIAPKFGSWDILVNRLGVLVLASSFLLFTIYLYPRLTNPKARPRWISAGLSFFIVGVMIFGGLGYAKILDLQRFENWASVHREHQSYQQTDVESITGSVEIRPGRTIEIDLNMVLAPSPEDVPWVFSLNPGYRIKHIAVDEVAIDDYEFKDGLLRVPPRENSAFSSTLQILAQGIPDPLFAYLDSAVDWKTIEPTRSRRISKLGQKPYVFHSKYVALLPGVSWFPVAGPAYGRDVFETHRRDFFYLDLEVSIPDGWLVAGPGTRQLIERKGTKYRFNPHRPMSEFALITSKFERRTFNAHGIEFELLLSPKHTKNLIALAPAVPAMHRWVTKQLTFLEDRGLSYPFGTLSFVEVPTHLRIYGGGWKMGSVYSPPGIHMIRESGFPIAPFDRAVVEAEAFAEANAGEELDVDIDRIGSYLFEHLRYYFQNDLHGGSPMVSLGEQFLGFQATPHGKGSTALHAFVNELVGHLALDGAGMFSIYFILEGDVPLYSRSRPTGYMARNFIALTRGGQISRSRVWEPALRTALSDLNFNSQPRIAADVISLKSYAISRTVRELVPHEIITEFLATLLSDYRGGNYSVQDFMNVAMVTGIDFESLVGDWLNSTELPGFLLKNRKPVVELVPSGTDSKFEYQTSFILRNNESIPGALGVESVPVGEGVGTYDGYWHETIHFPGNTTQRIALRSAQPVSRIALHPHLALNRDEIYLWIDNYSDTAVPPAGAGLPYVEPHDWIPVEGDSRVIVDDLSKGFSIVNGREHHPPPDQSSLLDYIFFTKPDSFNPHLNHGLPSLREANSFAYRDEFNIWFREASQSSFGQYYRTYVLNYIGGNESKPQFNTTLPVTGRWLLDYHVPNTRENLYPLPDSDFLSSRKLGIHKFAINDGNTTQLAELDLSEAPTRWNLIGEFELNSQDVQVTIEKVTNGVAIVDAIRWTPVE